MTNKDWIKAIRDKTQAEYTHSLCDDSINLGYDGDISEKTKMLKEQVEALDNALECMGFVDKIADIKEIEMPMEEEE